MRASDAARRIDWWVCGNMDGRVHPSHCKLRKPVVLECPRCYYPPGEDCGYLSMLVALAESVVAQHNEEEL
jgi:hypothetical protein